MNLQDALRQVDDYVTGRLVGDELEEFEILLLNEPELLREVQTTQELRDALASSAPATHSSSNTVKIWAVAASTLFALSTALHFVPSADQQSELIAVALTQEARLETVRSGITPQTTIEADIPTLIRIDVAYSQSEKMHVKISDATQTLVAQDIVPLNDFLTMSIQGLPVGDYRVQITGGTAPMEFDLQAN